MAQQPPPPPPSTQPANPPPPPPSPDATRAEWHAWRRQNRHAYWGRGWFSWGFFWPAALIILGVYFLLSNLGFLWWLRGDVVWPVLLILFGVALIVGRGRWWH